MKNRVNYLKFVLAAALVTANLSVCAFAEEEHVPIGTRQETTEKPLAFFSQKGMNLNSEEETDAEHVPVGERRLSQAEHTHIQELRAKLNEEKVQRRALQDKEDEELIAKKTYYTSHQGVFHRPIAINALGDAVTLEDGSVWQVRDKDRIKTLDWLAGDSILILPNHSWFSSYHYVLLNQNTGADVKVNLSLGPIYNGVYTHWIVAIDYYNKELVLEDGSVWTIANGDHSTMKKWLPNDTVIIGINDSWFSSKPNILINVNMLNYIAAKCIN